MSRSSKGHAGKTYKRGKRVQIYVHEADTSIGSFSAIFWSSDNSHLFYRETYQGKTEKIRWEKVDNVVPVAQRVAVGLGEPKGESVQMGVAREISSEAARINEINDEAPVTDVTPKRRKLEPDVILFILDELHVQGTSVSEIAHVLEIHWASVKAWDQRINGAEERESRWYKHGYAEIRKWFDELWTQRAQVTNVIRAANTGIIDKDTAMKNLMPGPTLESMLEQRVDEIDVEIDNVNDKRIDLEREADELTLRIASLNRRSDELESNRVKYQDMLEIEREVQSVTKIGE